MYLPSSFKMATWPTFLHCFSSWLTWPKFARNVFAIPRNIFRSWLTQWARLHLDWKRSPHFSWMENWPWLDPGVAIIQICKKFVKSYLSQLYLTILRSLRNKMESGISQKQNFCQNKTVPDTKMPDPIFKRGEAVILRESQLFKVDASQRKK